MSLRATKYLVFFLSALAFMSASISSEKDERPVISITPTKAAAPVPTGTPFHTPQIIPVENSPLKNSITAAGNYLVRQQLVNGELSYQVDFLSGERSYSPSNIRLIEGTGSLFTVCRVSGDSKFCNAGDLALEHYFEFLVSDPKEFKGTCLYAEGSCQLSGAALTVDAIYKRWQATSSFVLKDQNLLDTAVDLGYFVVSMRKPEGGFYQSFDPHFAGIVNPDYYLAFSSSEALLALLELYEMTGNEFWLKQAREVNAYMITQPLTEDLWHGYAFRMMSRLDKLNKVDLDYAVDIANTIIAGQVRSLDPRNTSGSTAAKIEALASIAQSLFLSGEEHEWLEPEIQAFVEFVKARQLPNNNCGWETDKETIKRFGGGVFSSCEDASIRIDSLQHWINGVTAYLEYQSVIKAR